MTSGPLPVDVTGRQPKGPFQHDPVSWAANQLGIVLGILDNPGGGLLFATQTIGQVRSTLQESDERRWAAECRLLERAEEHAGRREFEASRRLVIEAREKLS